MQLRLCNCRENGRLWFILQLLKGTQGVKLDRYVKEVPFVNCWFSVSRHQNKIKIKIKTFRQFRSRIGEMKGGKCTKTLAKIWVEGVIRIRDIRGNVLPKFIGLCIETPCWSSSG